MKYGIKMPVAVGLTLLLCVGSAVRKLTLGITPPAIPGMGDPLPQITNNPTDLINFVNGQLNMKEIETLNPATNPTGPAGQLGPLFNNTSCAACHSNPALGRGRTESI